MGLSITQSGEGLTRTVVVSGEVDVSNANELKRSIDQALREAESVLVNLADVPYIDSTGIGVLVGAAHRARSFGRVFAVMQPQKNVARIFEMLGVDEDLCSNADEETSC